MSILALIYGQSGTGKSTSMQGWAAMKEPPVSVFNVLGKPYPFRGRIPTCVTDDYQKIMATLPKTPTPSIVIDDATYLLTNEFMRNAKVTGYQKYTDMALNFNNLIECARRLPDDKIIYFMGHSEQMDDGREHFKTIGKMLDNYVTIEGKFTIVLKTVVKDGQYYFSTHNSGQDTVKSPVGMFEQDYIPNDLKAVDETIRAYYGIEINQKIKTETKEEKNHD